MELRNKKIVVTGGGGFLGRYVVRRLARKGVADIIIPRSKDIDLRDRSSCRKIVKDADIVIHLAAQVGGIGFIDQRAGEIFYNNLVMGIEMMEAARVAGVKKFVAVGTVCEYPRVTPLPFREENLWDGYPEETTAPYRWAKKMLIVQAKAYKKQYGFTAINMLPVNLYGPEDNFNRESAHVIPALIRRIVEAREKKAPSVTVWGSGRASREFLYVEDAADGIVQATEKYGNVEPINLGSGEEKTIKETVELIMKYAHYNGRIVWDRTKPDGQPRRQLDVTKAYTLFGFKAQTPFSLGLKKTIEWYEQHS
jgi:GDP-L-fucose synthase